MQEWLLELQGALHDVELLHCCKLLLLRLAPSPPGLLL
jgi:hypothetical protein